MPNKHRAIAVRYDTIGTIVLNEPARYTALLCFHLREILLKKEEENLNWLVRDFKGTNKTVQSDRPSVHCKTPAKPQSAVIIVKFSSSQCQQYLMQLSTKYNLRVFGGDFPDSPLSFWRKPVKDVVTRTAGQPLPEHKSPRRPFKEMYQLVEFQKTKIVRHKLLDSLREVVELRKQRIRLNSGSLFNIEVKTK